MSAHRCIAVRLARIRALSLSMSMTWSELTWRVARKRAKLSLSEAAMASGPASDAQFGPCQAAVRGTDATVAALDECGWTARSRRQRR